MKYRKVYIGEMEVDFDTLKAGDKCLLVDEGIKHFLIEVHSNPYVTRSGELGVGCEVLAEQEIT
jgi:hypothetical protein